MIPLEMAARATKTAHKEMKTIISSNHQLIMHDTLFFFTEIKCTCTDNKTTLLIVIGVLVTIIILLIAVIIWQHRKLSK